MKSLNNYMLSFVVTLFNVKFGTAEFSLTDPYPLDETYYENCAPPTNCNSTAKYRTTNGTCNNLDHPLWGATDSPFVRLKAASYADGDHSFRTQSNGEELPPARLITLAVFMSKSSDVPDIRNLHLNQVGQWVTHDITLTLPDFSGPRDCCEVQNSTVYPQCEAIMKINPDDDPIYGLINKTCIGFRRAVTSNSHNCTITPQIQINLSSAFIDASQLYGHTETVAENLRNKTGGRLKSEIINGQEFCTQEIRNGSMICCVLDNVRDNVSVCFDQGDPRSNQHYGITLYNQIFTRLHNYLADSLAQVNPNWSDETLYQEARRIVGAVNQLAVYRDYLPTLLGATYAESVGLTVSKKYPTVYDPKVMPQISAEFTGACFRVPHNTVPSIYYYIDKDNKVVLQEYLNEVMFYPDPLIEGTNFDDLLRGMSEKPGRFPLSSYNFLISNFMFHNDLPHYADLDLLSIDIQRGRDMGLPSYTTVRELCGFQKIESFEDLIGTLPLFDISLLKSLYADVSDVDLIVGALLEPLTDDGTVGETARCIITDAFYRLRYGDRFFFDVEDQPGSFSPEQLEVLWSLDLSKIFCAMSNVGELPSNIFMPRGCPYTETISCKPLDLDLKAWAE